MYTPDQIGTGVVAGLLVLDAAWTKFVLRKKTNKQEIDQTLLSDAKAFEARAIAMTKLAEDNLKLYQGEHEEHIKTRDFWHTKATEFQVSLACCQEKLTEANNRPDYSELAQFFKHHSDVSSKILEGIDALLKVSNRLLEMIESKTQP